MAAVRKKDIWICSAWQDYKSKFKINLENSLGRFYVYALRHLLSSAICIAI